MLSKHIIKSRGSTDTPDLGPRAIGLETAVVKDITSAEDMSASMTERPLIPPRPRKKAHLDEVIRLMKELEELRVEKGQAEEMADMMGQDLQISQEEVEKKSDELRRKEEEMLKCGEELKNWRQAAQSLSVQLQEEQELHRVAKATLHDTQGRMSPNGIQEQELQQILDVSLRSTKEEYEANMREAEGRTGLQIAELQKRTQEAETSLQEHLSRPQEVRTNQQENLLLQRIQGLESEVQDQRKRCDWFKKNSERLSREVKETQATRRAVEQSEYVARRQVADLNSQIAALQ